MYNPTIEDRTFNLLRQHGPLEPADVARRLEVKLATVNKALEMLRQERVVKQVGKGKEEWTVRL